MPQEKDLFDSAPVVTELSMSAPDTGVVAGAKRGLSNLNPVNWVEPPSPFMQAGTSADQKVKSANDAMTNALQHPVRTFINSIPLVGPYLAHMAETAPQDPSGALAESAVTFGVPAAIGSIPSMEGIRSAATRAEIPQLGVKIANTPLWKATGAGPVLDYLSRRLYEPPAPTPIPTPAHAASPIYNAEFVDQPKPDYIDVEHSPAVPNPPPSLTGRVGQLQIPATTTPGTALPSSRVNMTPPTPIPGGRGQVIPSAVMTGGETGQLFGESGGIPKRNEQTVTGQKPKPVRTPEGPMRKGTAEDIAKSKGNIGKTVTESPTPPRKGKK